MDSLVNLSWIIPLVTIAIVAIVVVPLVTRLIRNSVRTQQLLSTGVDAQATILSVWETGTRINEQPQIGMNLQVQPPNGPAFQSQATMIISFMQASMFQPGARVQVKYDPNDTSKVAVSEVISNAAPITGATTVIPQTAQEQQLVAIDAANELLRANGEAVEAKIMNTTSLGIMVNGNNPAMRVQLEIHPANRPMFMGQATAVISAASLPKYQPGATVWVKFNPNDLSQVALDHS